MIKNYFTSEKRINLFFFSFLLVCCSFSAVSQVLYSNGAISTGTLHVATSATAPVGYTWSELQTPSSTLGFSGFYNNAATSDFAIADEFVVPVGQVWNLTNVNFYGYQTNFAGTTPPIDAVRVRIWNGDPSLGTSTVVYGNMTTNVYNAAGSGEEFVYRVSNVTGTTRKVWRFNTTISTSLTAGTYWIEYQVHATNDSSVFIPPVTIIGTQSDVSWNAKQRNAATWAGLVDTGSTSNKALPFQVIGTSSLGVSSNSLNTAFAMYPMPVKDVCNFKLQDNLSLQPKTVSIYDLNGRLMQEQFLADGKEFSVSMTNLQTGVYLLKIVDENNKVLFSDRIIKD